MNFMELRIETFCISKIDPLHPMKNKNVRSNLRFAFPPFPFYATVFDQSDSLKMMTFWPNVRKKKLMNFFVLFVVQKRPAAFCYFRRVFRSKNCFPLKTIWRRKKKQELILSGCVWSFLKFGKRQNNCFLRGELSVG